MMYILIFSLSIIQLIYSQNLQIDNKITLVVTTNVHGEIEPCG